MKRIEYAHRSVGDKRKVWRVHLGAGKCSRCNLQRLVVAWFDPEFYQEDRPIYYGPWRPYDGAEDAAAEADT